MSGATTTQGAPRRWYELELLDNRYASLHGLRVLAILSVIQFHVTSIVEGEKAMMMDRTLAASSLSIFFGMDLFFILSGFLIGSILFHSIETEKRAPGQSMLTRFYLRRVFRTFPSYYLVLTALALTTVLSDGQRAHLVYEYVYLTNFMPLGHTDVLMGWGWSLALEEQFYLVVPLFLFALTRLRTDRARIGLLLGLCVLALGIRLAIFVSRDSWTEIALYRALYFRTYTRYDTLVVGILLALVHRRWKEPITEWLKVPFNRVKLAVPALTCLWLLMFPTLFGIEHMHLRHVVAWGTLTSLMYFPMLVMLLHGEGYIRRALSWKPFRYIATLGYGIYLVHIPIVFGLVVPLANLLKPYKLSATLLWFGSLVVTTLASIALAYVMHILIEKPSLWIRDRIAA